jgi:hypothetical protein
MKNDKNSKVSPVSGPFKKIRSAKSLEQVEEFLASDNLASLVEVIRHETLGPLIHKKYVGDKRSSVRFEIASQKTATKDVLLELKNDSNQLVRTTAKESLGELLKENKELT